MYLEHRRLSDLVARLNAERRVWLRLAATRSQEEWQLSLLEVTVGEAPPGWRRQRWEYRRALFIASTPAGVTVARWLEGGRVVMKSLSVQLDLQDQIQTERRQSQFAGTLQPLPWPSVQWTLYFRNQPTQMLHDELVADDAPAFITFDLAAMAFFGLPSPTRSFSGREAVIREQDRRARIDSVRVRPTEVIVGVRGNQLNAAALTLGGLPGQRKSLRGNTREVRFPLPGRIPSGSWLALHNSQELLDRRALDPAWGSSDVEIEVDPVTEVEVLVGGGEGVSTEFKRELPTTDRSVINVMKTIAAFANGEGGTVLFGIDDDGGVVGLGTDDAHTATDRMTQLIRDRVRPHVYFRTELAGVDGEQVLLVRVEPGVEPPYGVGTTNRRIDYYVRRDATTFLATPADVRASVRARLGDARSAAFFLA
jgi:Putative DNA-binding domain